MDKLVVLDLQGARSEYEINKPKYSIGRDPSNDIVLQSNKVSRRHATLVKEPDHYTIIDLHSSNGIYINSHRITERQAIRLSDTIRIAGFRLRVLLPEEVAEHTPLAVDETTEAVQGNQSAGGRAVKSQEIDSGGEAEEIDPRQKKGMSPYRRVQMLSQRPRTLDAKREDVLFEIRNEIHRRLLEYMDLRKMDFTKIQDTQLRSDTRKVVEEIIRELSDDIPGWVDRPDLIKHVIDEALGLGPLEDYLADDTITEIMVNNKDQIYIERFGRLERVNRRFSSNEAVLAVIERIVGPLGRRIDESSPYVDARLRDGSRVNAIIPPLSLTGPSITIRKFARDPFTIDNLVSFGSLTPDMSHFMEVCVLGRKNIIISGGTGSGKTTLLNVVSSWIPEGERIVTVEDAAELQLPQEHVVSLESRPANIEGKGAITIRDLVRNSLRMRPDRIVVGECRGGEALDMLQAMNTGHDGSISTVHANTPYDSLNRLETMVLMAGVDMPVKAIRDQICSAINIVVQTARFPDGTRKITHISETRGFDEHYRIVVVDIMKFFQKGVDEDGKVLGTYSATAEKPTFLDELRARGVKVDKSIFEPKVSLEELTGFHD